MCSSSRCTLAGLVTSLPSVELLQALPNCVQQRSLFGLFMSEPLPALIPFPLILFQFFRCRCLPPTVILPRTVDHRRKGRQYLEGVRFVGQQVCEYRLIVRLMSLWRARRTPLAGGRHPIVRATWTRLHVRYVVREPDSGRVCKAWPAEFHPVRLNAINVEIRHRGRRRTEAAHCLARSQEIRVQGRS